jgi:hypothetical protein
MTFPPRGKSISSEVRKAEEVEPIIVVSAKARFLVGTGHSSASLALSLLFPLVLDGFGASAGMMVMELADIQNENHEKKMIRE